MRRDKSNNTMPGTNEQRKATLLKETSEKSNLFPASNGEMGELIRAKNWSTSPLGNIASWPQSLKTAVNLLLQSPVPLVMLWGEDGIMIYNDAYSVFAGGRHPFLLGSKVAEGWPEVADFNRNVMEKVLQGKTLSYKNQKLTLYRNNAPEEVWMDLNYSPIMDESGRPAGILAIVVETTQRVLAEQKQKEAEEALRESEEQFRTSFEQTAIGMAHTAVDGKWLRVNQKLSDILGYTKEEMLSEYFQNVTHPDDLAVSLDAAQKLKTGKVTTQSFKKRYIKKDGDIVWAKVTISPLYDQDGSIKYFISAIEDITEQRKAEEALQQSESYFRALVNATSDVIYRMSPDWSEMRELEGRNFLSDTGDPIGDWLQKYIHPKDQQRVSEVINEAVQTKSIFQLEHQVLQADGTLGWTFSRAIPILDHSGEITEWFGAASDVTEHKIAEERLRASEDRLRRIFENSNDGIFLLDLERDQILEANPRACQMFGYGRSEILITPISKFHPKDLEKFQTFMGSVDETGHGWTDEFACRAKDGRFIASEISASSIIVDDRTCVLAIVRDITDRKRAEEALAEREERFRTLADSIQNLAWMANPDGWIFWYNKRWYEYTGTTLEEMQGWGWKKVQHPDHVERIAKFVEEAWQKGEPWELTFPLRCQEGAYQWFLTRAFPVRNSQGMIMRWIGTNTNIDEQKRALEQKDEFMSIASHELKTPMTSIVASLQILDRMLEAKKFDMLESFLKKADAQVKKLAGLVDDLLDVSRIRTGAISLSYSEFGVRELIEDCIEYLDFKGGKHQITLQVEPEARMKADKARIEQVICNLLTNAVKYSPEADRVLLRAAEEGTYLKVAVTDFGIGIAEEKQALIFNRFYRAQEALHQFQGLGLGLYISHEIVTRHGGKMWVESREGKGSTFYFTIPIAGKVDNSDKEPIWSAANLC